MATSQRKKTTDLPQLLDVLLTEHLLTTDKDTGNVRTAALQQVYDAFLLQLAAIYYTKNETDLLVGSFRGVATPATDPGPVPGFFITMEAGTYPNFGNAVVNGNSFALLSSSNGADWFVSQSSLTQVVNDLITNDGGKALSAAQGVALRGFITDLQNADANYSQAVEKDFVATPVQPVPESASNFADTTSTFSGWATSIGVQNNFNAVVMRIRARTTPITAIRWSVAIQGGATIQDSTIAVNIPANTAQDVVFLLDATYENAANDSLVFTYLCNQRCDRFGVTSQVYFPQPTYQMSRYATNGSQNYGTMVQSAGSANRTNWFKIGIVDVKLTDKVANPLRDFADSNLRSYFDDATKASFANSWQRDAFSMNKQRILDNPVYLPVSTVISGWGAPIGTPQNFNGIRFRVKSKTGGDAITSLRCRLCINSASGTVIEEGTIAVNIASGDFADVNWILANTVANGAGDKLFFSYAANAVVDLYGVSGQSPFPETSGYGQTVYYTNGGQTGSGVLSNGRYRMYCEIGLFQAIVGLTSTAIAYLLDRLNITSPVPSVTCQLPSRIYAVQGKETNIYFENIVSADFGLNDLEYDVTCTRGKHYGRRWVYLPTSGDINTTTSLTLSIRYKGIELLSKTTSVITKAYNTLVGTTVKVLSIGDSRMVSGQPLSILVTENITTPTSPTLSFIGSLGTSPKKHEGRSGYKWSDYVTAGRTFFRFNLTGVASAPSLNAIYTNNGSSFTVSEINLSGGTGYISCTRTAGINNPLANGTLTRSTGTGDATLTYSAYTIPSANPFWNSNTNQLDIAGYLTANNLTLSNTDAVFIDLGVNDIFASASAADLLTIKGYIDTFIAAWRAAAPFVNISLSLLEPAASQDAFGESYGNGQTRSGYMANRNAYNQMILDNYDNDAARNNLIFIAHHNCAVDIRFNVQYDNVAANARNSVNQVMRNTNAVHLAQSGYDQKGDVIYATLLAMI